MVEGVFALLLWGGACWVLRGGKFGALVRAIAGVEPGTTITRVATMGLFAFPFGWLIGPEMAIALWAALYLGSIFGYFGESMGLERPGRDHALMAAWGFFVAMIATSPLWIDALLHAPLPAAREAMLAASPGALAAASYAINKPLGRRFGTDWTERAEFGTGAVLAACILLAAGVFEWMI